MVVKALDGCDIIGGGGIHGKLALYLESVDDPQYYTAQELVDRADDPPPGLRFLPVD